MFLWDERNKSWKEHFNRQTEKKSINTDSGIEAPQKAEEKFLQEEEEKVKKFSALPNDKLCISM